MLSDPRRRHSLEMQLGLPASDILDMAMGRIDHE
jgi:hypothetical protein